MATQIKGLRELGVELQKLSDDVKTRIARAATYAGAKVIKDRAKTLAPVDTGDLRDNIITKRLPRSQTDLTDEVIVTVRKGKGKYTANRRNKQMNRAGKEYETNPLYYGHMQEFGTVKMAAHPFLRPAIEQTQGEAVDAVAKRIAERIEKANKP